MEKIERFDRTENPSCEARVELGDRPRVTRALAERLAVVHRLAYVYSALPIEGPEAPLTPEEKLLRAIFGEAAESKDIVVHEDAGAEVCRHDVLLERARDKVWFDGAERATVESVTVEKEGLPAPCVERATVVVAWPGPVTVGDELLFEGAGLGVIEAIVDSDELALWTPRAIGARAIVTRRTPTARQRVRARGVGPYGAITQVPVTGQVLRDDQLAWLARAGAGVIAGEIGAYMFDPILRARVFEQLVKLEPVADPWAACNPETP